MPTVELTTRRGRNHIDNLAVPDATSRQIDYNDGSTAGLTLRVFSSGRRSWLFRYRAPDGTRRRMKLGDYPALSLEKARREAERLRVEVRSRDPLQERREHRTRQERQKAEAEAESLGTLIRLYIERKAEPQLAPRTVREVKRILLGESPSKDHDTRYDDLSDLRKRKANEVTDVDVARMLDRIEKRGSMVMCNRTQTWLSAVYTWASTRRVAGVRSNPVRGLPRRHNENHGEKHHLADDDIRAAFSAIDGANGMPSWAVHATWLILATGQRPGEVLEMRWDHLTIPDADSAPQHGVWKMPSGYRKRVRGQKVAPEHDVPLSALALSVLRSVEGRRTGYVFPSAGRRGHKTTGQLNQRIKRGLIPAVRIEPFSPHDLRRTCATHVSEMGYPRHVVEKLLGHVDNTVAGVYDRNPFWPERVEAADAWGARLRELVGD